MSRRSRPSGVDQHTYYVNVGLGLKSYLSSENPFVKRILGEYLLEIGDSDHQFSGFYYVVSLTKLLNCKLNTDVISSRNFDLLSPSLFNIISNNPFLIKCDIYISVENRYLTFLSMVRACL